MLKSKSEERGWHAVVRTAVWVGGDGDKMVLVLSGKLQATEDLFLQ